MHEKSTIQWTSIATVLMLLALPTIELGAQELPAPPRLVVHITVDQLRTDYLQAFSQTFSNRGIKRLWQNGIVYTEGRMPQMNVDNASAVATLFTGATPSVHGIISDHWFDRKTQQPIDATFDSHFIGNYTNETASPKHLLALTVPDILKQSTQGHAIVYSIAPTRDAAILSGGHSANSALWIDASTGKWCSSTFYQNFPRFVENINQSESLSDRIESISWQPLNTFQQFSYLTTTYQKSSFKYRFKDYKPLQYKRFIESPLVNDEVNKIAEACLNNTAIGRDETPDYLSVNYTIGRTPEQEENQQPLELQDSYTRLDNQVGNLLDAIDLKIGLKNALIIFTGTGYDNQITDYSESLTSSSENHIPGGKFSIHRCAALLNLYLMASFGDGQWVAGQCNNNIYLDHNIIKDKKINLQKMVDYSAAFLTQFSGVAQVYTSYQLLMGNSSYESVPMQYGFSSANSGDLLLRLLPGWKNVNEYGQVENITHYDIAPCPIIIMGPSNQARIIKTPVRTTQLAPTIARLIRIRGPNGCSDSPLF
ncbi:MAG: alkaline phosphatase family protein [Bacteroidaceae bacterium]